MLLLFYGRSEHGIILTAFPASARVAGAPL
jgi:hypothetical protein